VCARSRCVWEKLCVYVCMRACLCVPARVSDNVCACLPVRVSLSVSGVGVCVCLNVFPVDVCVCARILLAMNT